MFQTRTILSLAFLAAALCAGASSSHASGGSADLRVTVFPQQTPIIAGTHGAYSVGVANLGPDRAEQIVLTNVLPAGATADGYEVCLPGADGSTCTFYGDAPQNGVYTIPIGDLEPGEFQQGSATVYIYILTPKAAGALTDTASATSITSDPDLSNNSASGTIELTLGADLELSMAVVQSRHSQVTVTVAVTNNGPEVARDVRASVTEFGGDVVSATTSAGTCTSSGFCSLGDLAVGSQTTVTVVIKMGGGDLSVSAFTASQQSPDIDFSNNTALASITNKGSTTDSFQSVLTAQPGDLLAYVSCANEYVEITGNIFLSESVTVTPNGSGHYSSHQSAQNMVGVGLTTGTRYAVQDTLLFSQHFTALPADFTQVSRFKLVGQGGVGNLYMNITFHYTINANGSLTSLVDHESITCQ